jgi:hypothetical protein
MNKFHGPFIVRSLQVLDADNGAFFLGGSIGLSDEIVKLGEDVFGGARLDGLGSSIAHEAYHTRIRGNVELVRQCSQILIEFLGDSLRDEVSINRHGHTVKDKRPERKREDDEDVKEEDTQRSARADLVLTKLLG